MFRRSQLPHSCTKWKANQNQPEKIQFYIHCERCLSFFFSLLQLWLLFFAVLWIFYLGIQLIKCFLDWILLRCMISICLLYFDHELSKPHWHRQVFQIRKTNAYVLGGVNHLPSWNHVGYINTCNKSTVAEKLLFVPRAPLDSENDNDPLMGYGEKHLKL